MSSPTKHIPCLDGWRGLAIIAVLVSHFKWTQELPWLGGFGVQLFFVLSGFLMGNLLFIKKVPLKDFFVRRMSRVFPTFWLFVIAMALYAAFLQPVRHVASRGELLSTFAFLCSYFPADMSIWHRAWPIGHLWSLSVEEHSYMFLAAGALLVGNLKNRYAGAAFLLAGTAAIMAVNAYYPSHPPAGATPWFLRSESAAIGLVAAAAYRVTAASTQATWLRESPPWLPVLSFIMAIACYSIFAHKRLQYTVGPLCLAYTINHLERTPQIVRQLLSSKVMQWFGVCSFSLYLWQQPIYYAVIEGRFPPMAGLVAAIAVGAASYFLFENPMRLYLNRKWAERRPLPAATAATAAAPIV
ncbi:acyltransferase family protein [Massilia pseudoviolaceinigra]|uniref:acyltransferase family protein n=1 Tax=Massilia pseudoviolaceinigra TaxID=3057165 RepID=UPI0027966163|nr:acyltransferase [Massilia sp. CCM 9206]MDQ1924584.1 acyltransferase [Massilia sp. CCM 9206]